MSGGGVWEWLGGMFQGLGNLAGAGVEREAALSGIEQGRATMDEKQRRLGLEQTEIMGQAGAAAASSGFAQDSRSITNYLGTLKSEMDRQAAWTRAADERALSNAKTAADWKFAGSFLSFLTMSTSTMGQGIESGRGGLDSNDVSSDYDRLWSTTDKPAAEQKSSAGLYGDYFLGNDSRQV